MHAAVPSIEIADDADPLRIRRPHRKVHTGDVADRRHVRAKLLPRAVMRALSKEVQIVVRQHLAVLIRVDHIAYGAAFVYAEAVGEIGDSAGERNARFEEPCRMTSRHRRHRVRRDELHR